jgi:hypothetical protein
MAKSITAWYRIDQVSVGRLRAELVGDGSDRHGGLSGKFKAAARASLHYWRRHYAHLHFTEAARPRYDYPITAYEGEHRLSVAGRTINVRGQTLVPHYSRKQYKQARNRLPVLGEFGHELPLVFSGNTRRGILDGPFRTEGASAKIIRGRWSGGGICWAWLAKAQILGYGIGKINPQEAEYMVGLIRKAFYRLKDEPSAAVPRDDGALSSYIR